jgi:predicted AlkP superfamily pyrophosphatase or phosphodiesterase
MGVIARHWRAIGLGLVLAAIGASAPACATAGLQTTRISTTPPAHCAPTRTERTTPKLILLVVIDQFRADAIHRFQSRFLPARQADGSVGGVRYLQSCGSAFTAAEHDVLQAMTAPGHASIATGAWPYRHGIVVNKWFDQATGEKTYCVGDPSGTLIGVPDDAPGRSPANLLGPTLGDTLKNAGYGSRVVSIALKDRAAILMGGHRPDAAIWMHADTFQWTTSSFYRSEDTLPEWVASQNAALEARRGEPVVFESGDDASGHSDDGKASYRYDTQVGDPRALALPFGYEVTIDLAEAALTSGMFNDGEQTDLLMVSLSSHDYLGHEVGPNRQEMEDMAAGADRALARLLNLVDTHIPGGLGDVSVVLTGDHGVAARPEYTRTHQLGGGRLDPDEVLQARLEAGLRARFGAPQGGASWVLDMKYLQVFLNRKAVGPPRDELERATAELLRQEDGLLTVFTRGDILAHRPPAGRLGEQAMRSYVAGRSGDVVGVPLPYWIPQNTKAHHWTGYSYDRMVPLIMAGWGVRHQRFAHTVQIIDIAPTLATLAGALHPALSEGRVLDEAIVLPAY